MAFQYGYDGNGNRTGKTGTREGRECNTKYGYDALQRVSKVEYPGGDWEAFLYDRAGNRAERLTGTWKETYKYDVRNRLRKRTGIEALLPDGGMIDSHSSNPREEARISAEKTMPSITTLYGYDQQGNTLTEETWKGLSSGIGESESNGLPEERIKKTAYEYNGFLKPSRITIRDFTTASGLSADKDASEHVQVQENFYDAEHFRMV